MLLCTPRILVVCILFARLGLAEAIHTSEFRSHARRSLKHRGFDIRQDPPPSSSGTTSATDSASSSSTPTNAATTTTSSSTSTSTSSSDTSSSAPSSSNTSSASASSATSSGAASSSAPTSGSSSATDTSSSTSSAGAATLTSAAAASSSDPGSSSATASSSDATSSSATTSDSSTGTDTSPPASSVTSATLTSAAAQSVSGAGASTTADPSSSSSCQGLLCALSGILDPTAPTSSSAPASATSTAASGTVTDSTTDTATAAPASAPLSSVPTSAPVDTGTVTAATATATSSSCGDLLGCIITSLLPPSPSSTPGTSAAPTSSAAAPASSAPASSGTDTTTPTSSDCGLLCSVTSAILAPPSSTPASASNTHTDTPTVSAAPTSQSAPPVSSIVNSVTSAVGSDIPTTSSAEPSLPTSGVDSILPTSTAIISFPSSAAGSSTGGSSSSAPASDASSAPSATTPTDFPFLSGSTLVFTSISTTNDAAATLTNPDQPTSSFSLIDTTTESALPSPAVLPTGTPGRIVPMNGVDPASTDLSGFTLISILFNQELNWDFVSKNQVTSSQIFAYFPPVIQTALGIGADQVLTFALQVYVPVTYQGPSDANDLGTMYLAYIPSSLVDTLAAQIKAKQSPFYTGTTGIAAELAARVDSSFSLFSVPNPQSSLPNSGGPQSANTDSGSLAKTRQNAIIGVVSTLGAIAVIILGFLVYRSFKRRQELGHHRLSGGDPLAGLRPEGREFDEDSVGGQRRRSFYFAEDSLRHENERQGQNQNQTQGPAGQMSQRRVLPATISAPILTESSMNW